jgi:hypothetical protein
MSARYRARMEKDEVLALCKRLNREHPRRRQVAWVPRELNPGDWVVSRVPRAAARGADHGRPRIP